MILYKDVCDLLGLSLLVYSYGSKFILEKDQNITDFLNNNRIDDLTISDIHKQIITNFKENSPLGEVIEFINDKDSDLQCIITKSDTNKRISVIFRGSESLKDWSYDLSFFKKLLKDNIYVHGGFYKHLTHNDNHIKITNIIKKCLIDNKDYEIYISGHSLGGALSTLYGYLLGHEIDNKVNIISFASPRVGDYNWRTSFDNKENIEHYRISNKRDTVVAIPIINYYHVGTSIILEDKKFSKYEDYSYNALWDYSLIKCFNVFEHSCKLYYTRLLENVW